MDSLDFDQVGELIEKAGEDEELSFVHVVDDVIWYKQAEPVLKYIKNNMSLCLETIPRDKFDHLKPPELREKYL